MSEPFVAEIRIFAGNFAPRGWAVCNGQLLPIAQNQALFSLLGTTYGGDGRTTTALPDLQGRAPMHPGRGPGLTDRRLGQAIGSAHVTLTEAELPNHTHPLVMLPTADDDDPGLGVMPAPADGALLYGNPNDPLTLSPEPTHAAGQGAPHENRQPFLGLNFIIALVGLYPSRS